MNTLLDSDRNIYNMQNILGRAVRQIVEFINNIKTHTEQVRNLDNDFIKSFS